MHYLWPESVISDINNRWEEEEKMGVLDIKRRVLFPIFIVPDLKRFLLLFEGNACKINNMAQYFKNTSLCKLSFSDSNFKRNSLVVGVSFCCKCSNKFNFNMLSLNHLLLTQPITLVTLFLHVRAVVLFFLELFLQNSVSGREDTADHDRMLKENETF